MIDLEFLLEEYDFLESEDDYEINLEANTFNKLDNENYVKKLIDSGQYDIILNQIDKSLKQSYSTRDKLPVNKREKIDELIRKNEEYKNALIKAKNKVTKSSHSSDSSIYSNGNIKIGNCYWYSLAAKGEITKDSEYEYIQNTLDDWKKNNYNDFKNTYFESAIEELAFAKYDISKLMKYIDYNKGDSNYIIKEVDGIPEIARVIKNKTLTSIIEFNSDYMCYCHEDNCCYIFSIKHEEYMGKVSLSQVVNASNKAYKDLISQINNYRK